ncbi:MAG: hypothetical protein KF861_14345, partial [Planctomycetaceae bacterium]|nr:hypothetical protein [Planctomycetaceae bacterium]
DLAMKNACGVCLLRLGKYSQAVHVYRGLVMAPDGLALRDDVPEALKLNFATALILDGKSSGGIDVLRQLDASHPDVERVRQELRHWERQLGFWNRTMWRLGIGPQRSVELGDAPGVLL